MKNITKIKIPATINYLSEHLDDLPYNCLFNKGLVGCGGTTIALTNDEDYIVCVPFVSLIQNKTSQLKKVFGVFKGVQPKKSWQYQKNY